ncbi:PREDICTED: transcription factor bHLH148-like [Ipomoea nil]|uniref:transcription factor bHLH148-like n=1 Tax=Ipomoea nil TaxID=35883 RepID=UPI0009014764|nr:PREDICTED: transcription factor bHLH148-like [Ipomoea nil]
MASALMSNPVMSSESRAAARRRKKKRSQIPSAQAVDVNNNGSTAEWKSEAQQQVYSSKLFKALREVRLNSSSGTKGGRAVHEVADRVLAVAAKGRTRWSRAILTNRLRLKFMKKHNRRQRMVVAAANGKSRVPKKSRVSILRLKTKNLPTVQRKARVLGRLVPGCRKEPLPVILEEATDYIAALEMQVRAMSTLAQLLSGGGGSSSSSSSAPLNPPGSSRPPQS